MSSRDTLHLLSSRLDFVDISILGKVNEDPLRLLQLRERLRDVNAFTTKLDNEIPQVAACRELMLKLKPQLSKSKSSLAQTMERLDAALAIKTELEEIVSHLLAVENTTQMLDLTASIDITAFQEAIIRVESTLKPLIELSRRQSEELDDFLSIYENTVRNLQPQASLTFNDNR